MTQSEPRRVAPIEFGVDHTSPVTFDQRPVAPASPEGLTPIELTPARREALGLVEDVDVLDPKSEQEQFWDEVHESFYESERYKLNDAERFAADLEESGAADVTAKKRNAKLPKE